MKPKRLTNRNYGSLVYATSILLVIVVPNGLVFAQEQGAGGTSASRQEVEEITVTARRRAEAFQNVPDTITVFSADTIENARIRKFDDLPP